MSGLKMPLRRSPRSFKLPYVNILLNEATYGQRAHSGSLPRSAEAATVM